MAKTSKATNTKDVILVGADVLDSWDVNLIGFSIPRLLPLIIDTEEMMRTKVLNPKDYDNIPTYHNGVLKFNVNTLMFIGKFMTGYLFADGKGKLFCFEFNEILRLRKAGDITFRGCKITEESDKQQGSIKFIHMPGITIEKLRHGDAKQHESIMYWETYVNDLYRFYGKYSYMYSILERVFTAIINKLDLMINLGYYDVSKVNREVYLRNIRVMNFANQYFYKNNTELNVVEAYTYKTASIGCLKLDVARSLLYGLTQSGNIPIYDKESPPAEIERAIVSRVSDKEIQSMSLSLDKAGRTFLYFNSIYYNLSYKVNLEKIQIANSEDCLQFICDCEGPDDNGLGLRITFTFYVDGRSSVRMNMINMLGEASGYRYGFEEIIFNSNIAGQYGMEFFEYNSFVDKELALKYKIYTFNIKRTNKENPELRSYLGVQGFEVEDIMREVGVEKPAGKLNFVRLVQLNRYEFIKIYQSSTKKTNMYAELYIDGKLACGCAFDTTDNFDYTAIYNSIVCSIAEWHARLAEQNYDEYINNQDITLDNRWYSQDFLRPIAGKVQIIVKNLFGFCIVQDMLTGIYFLSYMLKTRDDKDIYSVVSSRDRTTMGFAKMCAFKNKDYAIGFMEILYNYVRNSREDVKGLPDLYNDICCHNYALKKDWFIRYEQDLIGSVALLRWICRALGGYGDLHEVIREVSSSNNLRDKLGIIS